MSKQIMTITGEHQFNELGKRIDGNAESIVEILQNDIQSLGETIRRMSIVSSEVGTTITYAEFRKLAETVETLQRTCHGFDQTLKLKESKPKQLIDPSCCFCGRDGIYNCDLAAKNGHIECLMYAHKRGRH